MSIVDPAIESYLAGLRPQSDPVLQQMERLALERGFPIIGPDCGRLLFILSRAIDARQVLELGSGFGYSAYWFARAMSEGEIHCTDSSAENRDQALTFFGRAGLAQMIHFHVGDALRHAERLDGPFDIVFNDVDKEQYPATVDLAVRLLRPGGLFITDNVLWKGRVPQPDPEDETTGAVLRFNRMITEHDRLETILLPLRDGLAVCLRLP